jgi:hypothetical protein
MRSHPRDVDLHEFWEELETRKAARPRIYSLNRPPPVVDAPKRDMQRVIRFCSESIPCLATQRYCAPR